MPYLKDTKRPPTVKLSIAEWTNVVTTVVMEIGEATAIAVLQAAIGKDRADVLVKEHKGPALTKQDNHAIIRELYPHIPGLAVTDAKLATRADKISWIISRARAAFSTDERFNEVLTYVEHRVHEFETAGGTIDKFPDPPVDAEQAEWDNIKWYTSKGPSCKGAKKVMNITAAITDNGSKVSFSWDSYPWKGGGNELAHFLVWNGNNWEGGKFDWIRDGGQQIKLLNNLRSGYNNHKVPKAGTPVAFAWTNERGSQRSNMVKLTWPGGTVDNNLPSTPAVGTDEFIWEPQGSNVKVTIPAWLPHWQLHLVSRRKHATLYGPDKKAGNAAKAIEYILPKSAAQYIEASKAAGDDGTLLIHINTRDVASPPYKSASWRIMKPLQRQAGEKDRLVGTDK
jgi:hypothetical protein